MARSVGSVSVSIVPDAEGFVPKARALLEPGARDIGDALGRAIGSSLNDSLAPYLEEIRAKLDLLGTKDVDIRVRADDNGSLARTGAEIAALDAAAASSGGGFSIFGSKIAGIGVLAVAAADIAIPAILAIGAAAAGAIAGLGVLGLGFSGIGAALEAHGKSAGGGGGGAGAGAALSQQSAQINAAAATRSAQDQLTQAIETQRKAETGLHDARVQALQDLEDLDNKLKDNTLSQQQAAINLRDAKATLAVELAAPGAGLAQYSDQISQARLNVALAQQKANELALQGSRLSSDDKTAHQQGVNGNPQVLAAQQQLIDANHKLAEAQANIAITAEKNAIALKQAQLGMQGAAGGADQFAAAMAKLNPLQRQFVEFLLTLKPLLDQLKLAASAFLPGLEQGFKNALPAFAPILAIVRNVATAMGQVFANIGAQFNTPEGRKFLAFLSVELPKQIVFLGNLFIQFGRILSGIFEAAGPLIDAFDSAFTSALNNTANAVQGGGLAAFFDSLIPLIKPTLQALGAIGGVVTSALRAIAPAMTPLLHLITQIADAITTLVSGPVGQLLVQTFIDVVNAVAPLIPLFLQILQTILPPLLTFIDTLITGGLAPLVQAIATALTPILPVLGKAITDLVAALAPFLVQLIQDLVPILGPLSKLFIDVLNTLIPLIKPFGELLTAITPLIPPLVSIMSTMLKLVDDILPILTPFIKALGTAMQVFANIIKPIAGILNGIATALNSVISLIPEASSAFNIVTGRTATGIKDPGAANFNPTGFGKPKAGGGPVLAGVGYRWQEFGQELFIPKVDGTIINAIQTGQLVKALEGSGNGAKANYFYSYGQSDPVATAHQTANRFAARSV